MSSQHITLDSFAIISGVLLWFAFVVLWKIYTNQIKLDILENAT